MALITLLKQQWKRRGRLNESLVDYATLWFHWRTDTIRKDAFIHMEIERWK